MKAELGYFAVAINRFTILVGSGGYRPLTLLLKI